MVRVVSMAGEHLYSFEPSDFQSVSELATHVATIMQVPSCSLATAAGEKLSPHVALDTLGEEELTAVVMLDPLLTMLQLQKPDGTLLWPNLGELHTAAAAAEEQLIRCACGIGAPGHLCGMPCLPWADKTVPAPPMFLKDPREHRAFMVVSAESFMPTDSEEKYGCPMQDDTPVIHAGARVVVYGEKHSGGKHERKVIDVGDAPMALKDLQALCTNRPDLDKKKAEVAHIDGEIIHPTINLVSYSRDEIAFQLGHSRYNFDDM
ncbi:hypothetical protein AK812_SmicGene10608 [Symbiodinium microadriaticum]|uniref:Uncharacterized protein n=1 Tax=Symbiodinium microadriaticum TaxID=2951 RepID=A0A1Q9EFF0_SYMMI|nr:hypothetical protein AK812_SmicGene10608 [Symbiodinium microadriaticum]CAE7248229.1 unnamed protein product [Symbiodinium microadriaticum]